MAGASAHGLPEDPEVASVRAGERFDEPGVDRYLRARLPELADAPPLEVLQFPGGHANLTYLLRFGERELVLRRPPLGPVAPRSHDMTREYKVLSGLEGHFDRKPRAWLLCEDPTLIGAVFLIMERMHGIVVRSQVPAELDRHADARRRMSFALIEAMADLHDVDYRSAGLQDLGKPEGFAERQVNGWKGRFDRAKHAENPLFNELHARLLAKLPLAAGAGLVHNDLKLDNAMLDPEDPGRIVTFLDWDMTTLGDPLIDLGTLLGYWVQADDPPERGATLSVTAQPGFPTRAEIAQRYADRRRIPLDTIPWYEAFAIWKTAVVVQQIYIRFVRGQTDDRRFALLEKRIPVLVEIADAVAREGGI
ncbi:MAG: phosphotransferase family protein [Myxococcota bacterium]|nr:phosphotransferase family protein [Myxococcota bacterium]